MTESNSNEPILKVQARASTASVDVSKISQDLKEIANKINNNPSYQPKIVVRLDEKKTRNNIKNQLQAIINNLQPFNVRLGLNANGRSDSLPTSSNARPNEILSQTKLSSYGMDVNKLEQVKLQSQEASKAVLKLKTLYAQLINTDGTITQDSKKIKSFKEELELVKKIVNEERKRLSQNKNLSDTKNNNADMLKNTQMKAETALSNLNTYTRNLKPQALSKYASEIERIKNGFKAAASATDTFKATQNFNDASRKLNSFKNNMNNVNAVGGNLFSQIDAKIKSFSTYLIGSGITLGLVSQFTKAIQTIKDMDIAMTELKKVTNETNATYQNFFNNSIDGAKRLGVSVADVIQATADFARLGYGMSDAQSLADAAIIYKNVGDGIENITDGSTSIISTMKAFGIEAENAMSIVDKFNAVGNNYSISSKNIGEALKRSASALSVAGNDINESIALIVAGNEVVQDADVVGTALKTSALRLTNTKGELEALGEESEGAAESVTKLQTQLLNLTKGKVDIMLNSDTFKSTYQIMLEMSKVWDEMTQKDQMAALDLMFGKRTANVGASIIQNMGTAEKVVITSDESVGSALEENSKYLDSIAGKTYQLKASLVGFWDNLIDSTMIKFLVDVLNGIVQVSSAFDGWMIKIPLLIASIAGLKTAFIGLNASTFGNQLKNTFNSMKNVGELNHFLMILKVLFIILI